MLKILLVILMSAAPVFAQPIVSPEVHSDGRVTFRLKATEAKEVQLHCQTEKDAAMQKDDQGIWSFTTDPLEPDIYAYSFNVDGLHVIDPSNPLIKYNLRNIDSQVHVPGPKSLPWEINDVPHGVLHQHFYKSAVASDERNFVVYTPPGYDPTARKRYPVLYLLHGSSDDSTAWSSVGLANVILDNFIARGQAKPMIVVMPLGYGASDIVKSGGDPKDRWVRNLNSFGETLLNEVMPQVDKSYKIKKGRDASAIAGLSMGGAESLVIGLNHLDRFAWIGGFSSGGFSANLASQFPNLNEKTDKQLRLLWIACGKDDSLNQKNHELIDLLKSKGLHPTWTESPGEHSFIVWRRYLAEFAPLLFQEKK